MSLVAVVDVETTGLNPFRHDRVVELAVVVVDERGEDVREMSTLVNPERDVGQVSIHGVSASDLARAPKFTEVISPLIECLEGSVAIAGHNVSFDRAFLDAEFRRAGVALPEVPELCTMRLAGGGRLIDCCQRYGVSYQGSQHVALDDARAAAHLLSALMHRPNVLPVELESWHPVHWPSIARAAAYRLMSRQEAESVRLAPPDYLQRLMDRAAAFPDDLGSAAGVLEYDDLLSRAIMDRHIDESEGNALIDMAHRWNLGRSQIAQIHRHRLRRLVRAALQDGPITGSGRRDLSRVAHLVGLDDASVAEMEAEESLRNATTAPSRSEPAAEIGVQHEFVGRTVCFTGESACSIGGELISRELAKRKASEAGVTVMDGVTKKLNYLVVSDPLSQSGKAKKARAYGIPLVHEAVFWAALGVRVD